MFSERCYSYSLPSVVYLYVEVARQSIRHIQATDKKRSNIIGKDRMGEVILSLVIRERLWSKDSISIHPGPMRFFLMNAATGYLV